MAVAIDPVCHMEVDTEAPPGGQSVHQNADYYFCGPGCKVVFDREPEKYLAEDYQPMEMPGDEPPGPASGRDIGLLQASIRDAVGDGLMIGAFYGQVLRAGPAHGPAPPLRGD